jgi:hypothetical protein
MFDNNSNPSGSSSSFGGSGFGFGGQGTPQPNYNNSQGGTPQQQQQQPRSIFSNQADGGGGVRFADTTLQSPAPNNGGIIRGGVRFGTTTATGTPSPSQHTGGSMSPAGATPYYRRQTSSEEGDRNSLGGVSTPTLPGTPGDTRAANSGGIGGVGLGLRNRRATPGPGVSFGRGARTIVEEQGPEPSTTSFASKEAAGQKPYSAGPPPPRASRFLGTHRNANVRASDDNSTTNNDNDNLAANRAEVGQTQNSAAASALTLQPSSLFSSVGSSASTAPIDREDPFPKCVLISGYTDPSTARSIVNRFESFGYIVQQLGVSHSHHADDGSSISERLHRNWIVLEYETELQAKKALCQNPMVLNLSPSSSSSSLSFSSMTNTSSSRNSCSVVVGVISLTKDLAARLGISVSFSSSSASTLSLSLPAGEGQPTAWSSMSIMGTQRDTNETSQPSQGTYSAGARTTLTEDDIFLNPGQPATDQRQTMTAKGQVKRRRAPKHQQGLIERLLVWWFNW